MTTETGAGQWGTALSMACSYFDLDCKVFMVKVSYEQKPFRREERSFPRSAFFPLFFISMCHQEQRNLQEQYKTDQDDKIIFLSTMNPPCAEFLIHHYSEKRLSEARYRPWPISVTPIFSDVFLSPS